jgi:hypothetical protein
MSDNVQLPVTGDGTADVVQATDEVAGVHFPRVKLDLGADGASAPVAGSVPTSHVQSSAATATWDSDTPLDTTLTIDVTSYASVSVVFLPDAGDVSTGRVDFEASSDNTNWVPVGGIGSAGFDFAGENEYAYLSIRRRTLTNLSADTPDGVTFGVGSYTHFRLRLAVAITGTLSVGVRLVADTACPPGTLAQVAQIVFVEGQAADGAAAAGNPVLVAGQDGTNAQSLKTNASGELQVGVVGTVPVDGSGVTQPVSDAGGSLTVDGTVAVSSLPSLGNVTVVQGTATNLKVDASGVAVPVTDNAGSLTVDQPTGSNLHMVVDSGTVTTVSTVTTVTNVVHVDDNAGNLSIDDGGNSITVDAPVATPVFVRLSDGASAITTLPVSIATAPALVASSANIGDVDVLTVPADPFGANADAASATGSISAKLRFIAATGIPVTSVPTTTVAQGTAANLNMTEASASAIKTSVELIDDTVYTDDTSTHATGTSKGLLLMAAATPTDAAVNANDIGAVAMTTDRKLHVAVQDALPAGSNAIGKLAANDGVDIGNVDVASVSGNVTVIQGTGSNLHTVVDSGTITTVSTVSTVTNVVHVDDNSGSLTVDAPVGTPVFARLSDGSAALGTGNGTAASALRVSMASDSTGTIIATQSTASNLKAQVTYAYPLVYAYNIPSQVHVASANTVHWDMFNADAALVVRVLSIRQIPNVTTAVTGVVFDWLLERTTAVGTGGSTVTAWLADLNDTALDADITCRSKPTGGATQSTDLFNYSLSSEETNAATIQIASQGGLELVPLPLQPMAVQAGKGIVLRQNQGIRCVQITNSNAGNTGWLIAFTVE